MIVTTGKYNKKKKKKFENTCSRPNAFLFPVQVRAEHVRYGLLLRAMCFFSRLCASMHIYSCIYTHKHDFMFRHMYIARATHSAPV